MGSAQNLVHLMLNVEHVFLEFGRLGNESHKSFHLCWEPVRDQEGNPFFLQKIDPFVLRQIELLEVVGSCNFVVSEFPLQHGTLGDVKVAWGKGTFLGKKALLVASEGQGADRKLSITNEGIQEAQPVKKPDRNKARY